MKLLVHPVMISLVSICSLSACGGDDETSSPSPPPPPPPSYTVGGSVSGLTGTGLTLRNGSETINISAGARSFAFTTPLMGGNSYSVSVGTQPTGPAQTCTLTNASGTIASAPVNNITVSCSTDPTIFAYVLRGSNDLFGLVSLTTMALDPDSGSLVPVGTPIGSSCLTSITVNRQNRLVFTTRSISPIPTQSVCPATFSIASINRASGLPDVAGMTRYNDASFPTQAVIHPNGSDLYILRAHASESSVRDLEGSVAPFRFDADGTTATATGSAISLGTAPRAAAIDNSATRMIISDQGALAASGGNDPGDLRVLDITNPQQPAPLSTYANVIAPYAVVAHPSAPYVYVSRASASSGYMLALNSAGTLSPIGSGTFSTPADVRSMSIGIDGQTLYAVGYGSSTIQAYSIGSDGRLTGLGAALSTGIAPISVTVDPTGKYVMVLNRGDSAPNSQPESSISLYSVESSGALTAVTGSPFKTGSYSDSAFVVVKVR